MRRTRTALVGISLLAMGLIVAACGSSSKPSAKSTTSSTASSAGSSSKLIATAEAAIKKYLAVPQFSAPGPAVDTSKIKGKSVLIVMHDTVAEELVEIQKGIEQAGAAIGLHISSYNGQGTVSVIEQGIQQGIASHVGAIVLAGVDPALVPQSVKAAEAAHIPVVTATDGLRTNTAADAGIFSMVSADYELRGELDADSAIVKSQGRPIYAVIEEFDNPVTPQAVAGIKKVFAGCSYCHIVATTDVEPTSWPTKLASETASLIRANPKVNFVFDPVDTMALFAVSGVEQAGAASTVSVLAQDGSSQATLALVQKGTPFLADPGNSPLWEGWSVIDEVARAMTGMAPGNPVVPSRYLDQQDLTGVDLSNLANVYGTSYVSGFEKLWGVAS